MPKISRPVVYTTLAVIIVAAFVLTAEDEPVRNGNKRTPLARHATNKQTSLFTQQDYDADFPAVEATAANVFQPLVRPTKLARGAGGVYGPNKVPSLLTQGDPNWTFTGMAEVNGVPTALLENPTTAEGVFLKHGEQWKSAGVYKITPQNLLLTGPDGRIYTVSLFEYKELDEEEPLDGFRPVVPPLEGPIGPATARSSNTRISETSLAIEAINEN